jgi:hypothetical protein
MCLFFNADPIGAPGINLIEPAKAYVAQVARKMLISNLVVDVWCRSIKLGRFMYLCQSKKHMY